MRERIYRLSPDGWVESAEVDLERDVLLTRRPAPSGMRLREVVWETAAAGWAKRFPVAEVRRNMTSAAVRLDGFPLPWPLAEDGVRVLGAQVPLLQLDVLCDRIDLEWTFGRSPALVQEAGGS